MTPIYFLRRSVVLPCCALVCLAAACSSGWSDEDERFVKTYTEILVLREQYPDTTVANPRVREVVQSNGYSWEEFRGRFTGYYTEDADKFRAMLDSARNRAQVIFNASPQPDTAQ